MEKELIIEVFNKNISGNNAIQGERVLNSDLITNVTSKVSDGYVEISGLVLSESFFNEYKTKLEIDINYREVFTTFCTCEEFEKNEFKKINYCCKHIMATFYYFLKNNEFSKSKLEKKSNSNLLKILLEDIEKEEEIKIEVYINQVGYKKKLNAEFRIGLKKSSSTKLYVLKDINQFLTYYNNKLPIKYGKDFTFDINKYILSTKDKSLINFLNMIKDLEGSLSYSKKTNKFIDGKNIYPPKHLIREFFSIIKNHRVYLNEGFYFRPTDCEILNENPDNYFDLKLLSDCYQLAINSALPQSLNDNMDVLLSGTSIYLPSREYIYQIKPYYNVFKGTNSITFSKNDEEKILKNLIPKLNNITKTLNLSKNIKEKVVIDFPKFLFYFDKENKSFSLTLKVKYSKYEFNIFDDCNEKIIYRNVGEENKIKSFIKSLGFDDIKKKYYLNFADDYIYKFFKYDIDKLQKYGEIYYSENFKGIKSITSKSIKAEIAPGKYDYFELKFKISNVPEFETTNVLRAFKNNLKYYKLSTGEYLDLEEIELKNFLKLINNLNNDINIQDNKLVFPKGKGLYLDKFIEENKIRYIKGKKELKELTSKFKDINKVKYNVPDELNANLRNYQKIGYTWLKTLDYFGFGGILGDEMGLGKTIQAITFLLSNKGCNTLVIAPTSLIYNWKNELSKFAPTLKIAIINNNKEDRKKNILNYKNYDVLITTYNLMKIDFNEYNGIEFDYIILDEAQNIKNPNSQNARIVKQLKGKRRFALTGTPIENSLMELWSIFDFIMPGYLYTENDFRVRYHKNLKESDEVVNELNKLIKPFILRRFKRDVVTELPEKIEKKIEIDLSDEEKKIYSVYSKHVVDIIEKKVKDDEFNKSRVEILSYITKLRQLCLDPNIVLDDYAGQSSKVDALIEILEKSIEEQHKVLVFSQFTSVLSNIKKRLNVKGIMFSYLDGSTPAEKRIDMVNNFNEKNNSVFLISLKAGGTGLNLTSADVVIHFDPWWNPAVEDQATDRAHRIGQKEVVEVIKLIAKDTIEEKIISLQDEKRLLISRMLGDELSGEQSVLSLSEEDIVNLFK